MYTKMMVSDLDRWSIGPDNVDFTVVESPLLFLPDTLLPVSLTFLLVYQLLATFLLRDMKLILGHELLVLTCDPGSR